MKARDAAAKAKRARIKIEREEAERVQMERRQSKLEMEKEAPIILAAARKEIARAVREGFNNAVVNVQNQVAADFLRDDGYRVYFREEEVNMGDSAAPGMVTIRSMEISW